MNDTFKNLNDLHTQLVQAQRHLSIARTTFQTTALMPIDDQRTLERIQDEMEARIVQIEKTLDVYNEVDG